MMKKSQGLPLEIIVAAAIMIIVVGVIILAFGGGFSSVFQRLNIFATQQGQNDTVAMEWECRRACSQIQNSYYSNYKQAANSDYCILRWDTSGMGGIVHDSCLDDPAVGESNDLIKVPCKITLSTGSECCLNCSRSTENNVKCDDIIC